VCDDYYSEECIMREILELGRGGEVEWSSSRELGWMVKNYFQLGELCRINTCSQKRNLRGKENKITKGF
jgi:hypothetical protein